MPILSTVRASYKGHPSGLLGLEEKTPAVFCAGRPPARRPEEYPCLERRSAEWIRAAQVKKPAVKSRFGFLGKHLQRYAGYVQRFSPCSRRRQAFSEVLEMCDLDALLKTVTEEDVARKEAEVREMFTISGDSPAEKPGEEADSGGAGVVLPGWPPHGELVEKFHLNA